MLYNCCVKFAAVVLQKRSESNRTLLTRAEVKTSDEVFLVTNYWCFNSSYIIVLHYQLPPLCIEYKLCLLIFQSLHWTVPE